MRVRADVPLGTRSARDARGRHLHVDTIKRRRHLRISSPDFCNCYGNFYVGNGGAVMARFGDTVYDEQPA